MNRTRTPRWTGIRTRARATGLVGAIVVANLLVGCESTPTTAGKLSLALDHYDAQRYSLAHQSAVEVTRMPNVTPVDREQAVYLAGLSAFQMGDMNEAELRLNAVANTNDRQLLGSSQALIGQIRLDQRRPAEAAVYFEAASRSLTGVDATHAKRYASMAHHEAGNRTAAKEWYEPASHTTANAVSGFTLQVGAFLERNRAEQAAAEASSLARGYGLGPVNIRQSSDTRGRPLFLVQFGQFPTRQAAANARASIGRLDYIVAPLSRG
jgi:hypothetical protein